MPQVQIGPDFFRQEARNYASISLAIVRELIQNAVDAKAKRIEIEIVSDDNGTALSFADNGTGMSREVLENVFFSLGATTKKGSDTTGGFGKARTLICLAQRSYEIRTRDMRVEGSGASYEIHSGLPEIAGCQFLIQVAWAELEISPEELLNAFRSYLSMCQLNVQVTIEGQRCNDDWACRRQVARRLSCGTVHVNKTSGHRHRLLVRVSGMLMFVRYVNAPVQVILEIDPAQSREILLSNRDGLRTPYREELDRFVQEISTDTLSALRDDNAVITRVLGGPARTFVARSARSCAEGSKDRLAQAEQQKVVDNTVRGSERTGNIAQSDPFLQGTVIASRVTDPRLKRAVRLFHPENWGMVHGGKRKQLLQQWIIACEWALDAYCQRTGIIEMEWRPGFVIDPDVQAGCQEYRDGTHALLINPVECQGGKDSNVGNILFKLRDWGSHARLLTLAAHEVTHCHVDCRLHGEAFSTLFTNIMADCSAKLSEIHAEMMLVT